MNIQFYHNFNLIWLSPSQRQTDSTRMSIIWTNMGEIANFRLFLQFPGTKIAIWYLNQHLGESYIQSSYDKAVFMKVRQTLKNENKRVVPYATLCPVRNATL